MPKTEKWHSLNPEEILERLNTKLIGLNTIEVQNRLKTYGFNTLKSPSRRGFVLRFVNQFNHILIYVLLLAAIGTALLGNWIDTGVILGVILINAIVGVIQESKAEKALDAIRDMLSLQAIVIRNGNRMTVSAETLVPGDVVLLKSGDKVPADLRIIDSKNLQIQESILTGESVPVEKSIQSVSINASIAERTCMAYSGTLVTYGKAVGIVAATGENTEVGRIGVMLAGLPSVTTHLLQKINQFSYLLTFCILTIAIITFIFGVYFHSYPMQTMFMAAIGLAVAAIPEGLPAIISITLAIGVTRMAKRNAIIRRLTAVETVGSITVICTDKTGTLTLNELSVQNIITRQNHFTVTGTGYGKNGHFQINFNNVSPHDYSDLKQTILGAMLCNDAELKIINGAWHLAGNPIDGALLNLGLKAGENLDSLKLNYLLTDMIPFESENKLMATLHHDNIGNGYIYVKGAPEHILAICSSELINDQIMAINKEYWENQFESLATQGQRVLAIALRSTHPEHKTLQFNDINHNLTMLALFGLIDPPREEAISAVSECQSAGIRVKMITGDSVLTAKYIAMKLGFKNYHHVITGNELDSTDKNQLADMVSNIDIYARTSPEHKLKLVEALQAKGNIVAMTGDGVNDAPALKRADVGIAMGKKGTEAAKEASEIVLADDNFSSIVAAIKEGRTVYDNIHKAILFILPTNGGEMLVILLAILLGWTLPITPVQILWVNMITEVTLSLALAFERSEKNVMTCSPKNPNEPIFSTLLIWRIIFISLLMLSGCFGLFLVANHLQLDIHASRTVAVNALVFGEIAYLFNSRKILASAINKAAWTGSAPCIIATISVIIFQIIFTYVSWMNKLFGTAPISVVYWCYIILFGISIFIIAEFEKKIISNFYK